MKKLLLLLGILIGCFITPGLASASIVSTYQVSGSASYDYSNWLYSGGKSYYYDRASAWAFFDGDQQFAYITSFSAYIANYNASSGDISICWNNDVDTGGTIAYSNTTSVSSSSIPAASSIQALSQLTYINSNSTYSIPKLNYIATYSIYKFDGCSYYIDSNGFVHFIVSQNSPNTALSYTLVNKTTGRQILISNQSSNSFEFIDYSPKPGATNIYDIHICGYRYSTQVIGDAYYQNIYVLVPGDQATYNVLTQGVNGDGKSLEATYDQAYGANISAHAAQTSAQAAQTAATTASNQTWYSGKYGGSSESTADITGYIRNAQLPGIDTKIDNLTTTINNINSSMSPPTIQKVAGQNGATCTTTGTFYIAVNATSGRSGQLEAQAQVDGGEWTGWYSIPQSTIPVTLSSSGAHTITVNVKDTAGITSSVTMTAFRI